MDILIRHSGKNDAGDITKIFLEKSNYRISLGMINREIGLLRCSITECGLFSYILF